MIDAVIGAAVGYNAEQLRPFLSSLYGTGYSGAVILYANGEGAQEARRWGVEVRDCPRFKGKPHAARFLWIQEALEDLPCEGVLLADTRDVIFQKDPKDLPSVGFHTFEEDRSMTLDSCPYNSDWIRIGYGEKELARLAGMPISCVGVSCGDRETVLAYLRALREEIERIQPHTRKPQDQAAHNHLVHGTFSVRLWNNEEGEVYTVGYLPRGSVKILEDKIVNQAGQIPAVIHQWDRHKNLEAHVMAKFI